MYNEANEKLGELNLDNFIFNKNEPLEEFIKNNRHEIEELLQTKDAGASYEDVAYKLIKRLNESLNYSENLIMELQAPIIPSIVPNTILVPITGQLTEERFDSIRTKILNNLHNVDTAIIDFTAIYKDNVNDIGVEAMSLQISQLNASLHLMGVEALYVGFSPEVIKSIVYGGVKVDHLNCHLTFRTALQSLMEKKEMTFSSMNL